VDLRSSYEKDMSRQVDSTPLRVAVIGTGFIGTVHVEAARRARAHVVGILGSSVKRAIPKARELVVPIVFDSLEELAQSPDVDLVHVTSPQLPTCTTSVGPASGR